MYIFLSRYFQPTQNFVPREGLLKVRPVGEVTEGFWVLSSQTSLGYIYTHIIYVYYVDIIYCVVPRNSCKWRFSSGSPTKKIANPGGDCYWEGDSHTYMHICIYIYTHYTLFPAFASSESIQVLLPKIGKFESFSFWWLEITLTPVEIDDV